MQAEVTVGSSPWGKFLASIRTLAEANKSDNHNNDNSLVRVFLSYAWEDTTTIEGGGENEKLQQFLETLRSDLLSAGISAFFDLAEMNGNINHCMQSNIEHSDFILPILTPRYKQRVANKSTNVGFEFSLMMKVGNEKPESVLPIIYKGGFDDSVPDELKSFLVRDLMQFGYHKMMVDLLPMGIIPAIHNVRSGGNTTDKTGTGVRGHVGTEDYSKHMKIWKENWQKLNRVPPTIPYFIGRAEHFSSLTKSLSHQGACTLPLSKKICGMGGVGKSQLAIAYAHKQLAQYDVVRFISAHGENMKLEFLGLAEEMGIIKAEDMENVEDDGEIVKAVWESLSYIPRLLLVYDNAENSSDITEYLPTDNVEWHHVIITSRSMIWDNPIEIGCFSISEAAQYIKQLLPHSTDEQVKELTEEMEGLPLAISHSVSYIQQTGMTIQEYLNDFRNKGKGVEVDEDEEYPSSLIGSLLLSIEKVHGRSEHAIKVLAICAYLAHDNIPRDLFVHDKILKNVSELNAAVAVLRDYSLVEPAKVENHFQVHRVTQLATRRHLEKGNDYLREETLKAIRGLLETHSPKHGGGGGKSKIKSLSPHLASIGKHLEKAVAKHPPKHTEIPEHHNASDVNSVKKDQVFEISLSPSIGQLQGRPNHHHRKSKHTHGKHKHGKSKHKQEDRKSIHKNEKEKKETSSHQHKNDDHSQSDSGGSGKNSDSDSTSSHSPPPSSDSSGDETKTKK